MAEVINRDGVLYLVAELDTGVVSGAYYRGVLEQRFVDDTVNAIVDYTENNHIEVYSKLMEKRHWMSLLRVLRV